MRSGIRCCLPLLLSVAFVAACHCCSQRRTLTVIRLIVRVLTVTLVEQTRVCARVQFASVCESCFVDSICLCGADDILLAQRNICIGLSFRAHLLICSRSLRRSDSDIIFHVSGTTGTQVVTVKCSLRQTGSSMQRDATSHSTP